MGTIEALWQRIEDRMLRNDPHAWHQLASGASEEQFKGAAGLIGVTFPEDFRASYQQHNGGYTIELVTHMEILSLEEIVKTWQLLKALLDGGDWEGLIPYYFTEEVVRSGWQTGPIQPEWWNPHWVPFGMDTAGNLCCLDLNPAQGGAMGQILDWDHECGPSRVLFSSFQQLLNALANQLESFSDKGSE